MSASPTVSQTSAMSDIVRSFIHLAPRLKAAMPEDDELLAAREKLYALHTGGKPEAATLACF